MRYIILIGIVIAVLAISTYMITQDYESINATATNTSANAVKDTKDINEISRIESLEHLREILKDSKPYYEDDFGFDSRIQLDAMVFEGQPVPDAMIMRESLEITATSQAGSLDIDRDYSSTNIQVEDVDEPDYIKNDGRYIYMVTRDILTIIDAYPAEEAEIILRMAIDVGDEWIEDIFLNGDRLIVFYEDYRIKQKILEYQYMPTETYGDATRVLIIDVTNRERPNIISNYLVDGELMDSRMINDHVYFVTNIELEYNDPKFPIITRDSDIIRTSDSFYFNGLDILSQFTTISVIDLANDNINSQSFLLGDTSTFYVSADNLYLTYQQHNKLIEKTDESKFFDVIVPLLSDSVQIQIRAIMNDTELDKDERWSKIAAVMQDSYNKMSVSDRDRLFEEIERAISNYENETTQDLTSTIIHKIEIDGSDINYTTRGQVSGRLLNQFSMDEYNDRFRVATTTERITSDGHFSQANAVYVMDEQLNTVGKLEQIAQDENIYSARFMGDRLYLVTFLQIDPFFVIDLTRDTPKILGELKIPGFSNYLHPFDDDHVIGVGRDTTINEFGGTLQLGVKIALFDASNVSNPRVLDQVIIGNGVTYSAVEHNHKAFFFDRSSKILSIPIAADTRSIFPDKETDGFWTGFFVYKLDKTEGFEEKTRINHPSRDGLQGPRTFYIEDVLYTASYELLKMNSINSLNEINSIKLQNTGKLIDIIN